MGAAMFESDIKLCSRENDESEKDLIKWVRDRIHPTLNRTAQGEIVRNQCTEYSAGIYWYIHTVPCKSEKAISQRRRSKGIRTKHQSYFMARQINSVQKEEPDGCQSALREVYVRTAELNQPSRVEEEPQKVCLFSSKPQRCLLLLLLFAWLHQAK